MFTLKKEFKCSCGKVHNAFIDDCIVESNAVKKLPHYISKCGGTRPFIIADTNTYGVAGEKVHNALGDIPFSEYIFSDDRVVPDEASVGSAIMHFDNRCDIVIGIGSGVINDISKIVANVSKLPYIIVATAPSMDGYASATSSVDMDGLKLSLPSKCANIVIGDIEILKTAPERMLISGIGDMLAKYISICEWRLSNIITGEYYCEEIASIVRNAVSACVANAGGLLSRDDRAIKAVFEGLVIGGVAMNYAEVSRPASGCEHYFSHIFDMRGLEFGTQTDFHGIQCAIGTLYVARVYEQLKNLTPDREKAEKYAASFDLMAHNTFLRDFLGKGAEAMISLDQKEKKYDISSHKERLERILNNWHHICEIIDEELPAGSKIEKILDTLHAPKSVSEIGADERLVPLIFKSTKDIRNKYVASRLCHDLGVIDEIKF